MGTRFVGEVQVKFLDDGRLMELLSPFEFIDGVDKRWPVPKGMRTDGASIPRPLWSIVGGPFEGAYRSAAIVHDWYCDVRTEPWRAVHRMFYEAMLATGTNAHHAKLLYLGVRLAGPRWSSQAVHNAKLALITISMAGLVGTARDLNDHLIPPRAQRWRPFEGRALRLPETSRAHQMFIDILSETEASIDALNLQQIDRVADRGRRKVKATIVRDRAQRAILGGRNLN